MAWETKTKIGSWPIISIGSFSRGIISIGWTGIGVINITQFGVGIINITQFGVGLICLNQFGIGLLVTGQFALGILGAVGQAALGFAASGYDSYVGYYSFQAKESVFGEWIYLFHSVIDEPMPFILWCLSWTFIILVIYLFRKKIKKKVLTRFFSSYSDPVQKKKLINSLVNNKDLEKIVLKENDDKIRNFALQKIGDNKVLQRIIIKANNIETRIAALKRINSQEMIKDIALGQHKKEIRIQAIDHLYDQNALLTICNSIAPAPVRKAAAKKIKSNNDKIDLLINETDAIVAEVLFKTINDNKQLFEIVKKGTDLRIRTNAASKIKDETILNAIAKSSFGSPIKIAAINNLRNIELLEDIEIKDNDSKIKKAATQSLKIMRPVFSKISVKIDCSTCSQPVFLNTITSTAYCSYCTSTTHIDNSFWTSILKSSFTKGISKQNLCDLNNVSVESTVSFPTCQNCGKEISQQKLYNENGNNPQCDSCNTLQKNEEIPYFLRNLTIKDDIGRNVSMDLIFSDTTANKFRKTSIKPVVITCVQCGGNLSIDRDTPRIATCTYCNTDQYLPDPLWVKLHPIPTKQFWSLRWIPTYQNIKK